MRFLKFSPPSVSPIEEGRPGRVDVDANELNHADERPQSARRNPAEQQVECRCCRHKKRKSDQLWGKWISEQDAEKIEASAFVVIIVVPNVVRPETVIFDDCLEVVKIVSVIIVPAARI